MEYVATVLGGVGLFLLGMWLITEGLKVAAGASLERLLASWTRNRLRGLLSGTLLTALVQSSSAITVAALGFVNTGLLRFERAVWVIFGSNLGTTLTAWVVALVGIKFQINVIALPLVGIGALMRVFAPADRYRNLGMALAGFGVLFLGIEVLSSGFQHLGESFPLPDAGTPLVWLVLLGIILTTLMQSSSAAVALVLTALAGGLLGFREAAAVPMWAPPPRLCWQHWGQRPMRGAWQWPMCCSMSLPVPWLCCCWALCWIWWDVSPACGNWIRTQPPS